MRKDNIRVVIDTNVWVSFLIGKTLSDLLKAVLGNQITILFSEGLFDELGKVLKRPKFRKYFSYEKSKELIAILDSIAERIELTQQFKACRDEKDNFLLDLCVSGNADYLITGDQDLLTLNSFYGTKIINYQSFQEFLRKV
jgi:putative PIN family toxin of toxin-antitoxin system